MKNNIQEWNKYLTGAIDKGAFCDVCMRFNNRQVTCGAIVIEDEKILLVKRAIEPNKDEWVVPGGYLDWDETVEEAVLRELEEETGFEGNVKRLLGIRSDLGAGNDRQNVDLFFEAERVGGEERMDDEVGEIGWFSKGDLPEQIAFGQRELISKYLDEWSDR